MAPHRTRLVRRAPLTDRIKAYLNPYDFLLWASEELNDWEDLDKKWSLPIGVLLNVIFMMARANSGGNQSRGDDVFADYYERRGSGWLTWLVSSVYSAILGRPVILTVFRSQASFVVYSLASLCAMNAVYTFTRKRHYRLFESNVDVAPSTPSAHRVRVDSSPLSSSPLRFLSSILASTSAESRAHPDAARDVWEIALWDPTPLCLRLFCLFSPGHIMVYWRFLPLAPLDPRPSITVATTMFLAGLVSAQLLLLQTFFSRQAKDSSLIYKEVQNEYDVKYVHPMVNRPVRDVGTQILPREHSTSYAEVMTYTPTTYVNRGFRTNPNPTYAPHYDPDGIAKAKIQPRLAPQSVASPIFRTPNNNRASDVGTPTRSTLVGSTRQAQYRSSSTGGAGGGGGGGGGGSGDGGSFGIYNHAHSPLKKATLSMNSPRMAVGSDNSRERNTYRREGSPLKKSYDHREGHGSDRLGYLRGTDGA